MGRIMTPLEAAKDAYTLLDQAILLVYNTNIEIPAAHADLARHSLLHWINNARCAAKVTQKSKENRPRLTNLAKI